MKKKYILLVLPFLIFQFVDAIEKETKKTQDLSFHIQGDKKNYSKLKSVLVCHGSHPLLLKVGKLIGYDLNFTDQFDVDLQKTEQNVDSKELTKLFKQGVSLVFACSLAKKARKRAKKIDVRLVVRDTSSNAALFDKKVTIEEKSFIEQGHKLSADVLEALTGDRGVCVSSLAFCQLVSPWHKIICLSDYTCRKGKVIVPTKAINAAPSWHTKAPVLFYSQLTRENNRLMSIDLRTNRKKVVCSYEGLNMQPAFSKDGGRAVLCLSGGKGNSELYLYDQRIHKKLGRRAFKQLTKNGAHNVSPCMLPNNDVIFCSNYETGSPQIYYLTLKTGRTKRLTNGKGYCAAPAYCEKTNMIVFTKPVKGTFQLFTFSLDDLNDVKERQVTFNVGNKHEPSWSPCGRYVVFSSDAPGKNGKTIPQVAVLNYRSGIIRTLTKGLEPKSFPRWYHGVIG